MIEQPMMGKSIHNSLDELHVPDDLYCNLQDELISNLQAVVLANGDYPNHPIPLQVLADAPYVVCCDGGADDYIAKGHKPDAIVGDGDSISNENRQRFGNILHCIAEQETNDQTKAINFLLKQDKKNIIIVGATGKREDHTLGNISLLIDYMRTGANVCTLTDYGMILACNGTRTFGCSAGKQVSIINFGAKELSAKGLKYPLSDFTNWWQGTLNECTAKEFTIYAKGEYLIMIGY